MCYRKDFIAACGHMVAYNYYKCKHVERGRDEKCTGEVVEAVTDPHHRQHCPDCERRWIGQILRENADLRAGADAGTSQSDSLDPGPEWD